jgi:hypothetical protein
MMQGLAVGVWHDRGEFDERLVVLTRQEQPNQVRITYCRSARRSS